MRIVGFLPLATSLDRYIRSQRGRNPFSRIRPLESSITIRAFMPRLSAFDTTSQVIDPSHQRRTRVARIGSNQGQPSLLARSRANSVALSRVMLDSGTTSEGLWDYGRWFLGR